MKQLTCVLMQLRLVLLEINLAHRSDISISSTSQICDIRRVSGHIDKVPKWLSWEINDYFMPGKFKIRHPKMRAILDCTNLFIETPSDYAT